MFANLSAMNSGIFLLFGTNQGDRFDNLSKAKALVAQHIGAITLQSKIYVTAAWGKTDQQDFYNQVVQVNTLLDPHTLLSKTLAIEAMLGRKREEKWGPRTIDIDILLYNDTVVNDADLNIPHPGIPKRRFTLLPLTEIAANLIHPTLGKTIETLLQECDDKLKVEELD